MRLQLTAALFAGAAALALAGERAAAQERIAGPVTVIDGDSFEIGGVGVRLFGVDAPEGRQACRRERRDWDCGDAARTELRRLIGGREVSCEKRDEDRYGRIVAVCRHGTTDLGAAMVRAGLAVAYRRYTDDYVDEEREAQAARRGVWAGEFEPPERWRREATAPRRTAARETPLPPTARRAGCAIKGNINNDGERIYHAPSSAAYDATVVDIARGERWFCSEAEARRAGWRAPRS